MKELFYENQKGIETFFSVLTIALLVLSIVLIIRGFYPTFHLTAAITFVILSFLAFANKDVQDSYKNIITASLIVADFSYLMALFFFLGRCYMRSR